MTVPPASLPQLAADDAVVLCDPAITAPARLAGGNVFLAPIDGSGFSRMVAPPIVAAEATGRGGATDRRRVSTCANEPSYACGRLVFSESFCRSSGFWCSAMTWVQRSRRSSEAALRASVRRKSAVALCRKEEM
jgi:hypothetical protein